MWYDRSSTLESQYTQRMSRLRSIAQTHSPLTNPSSSLINDRIRYLNGAKQDIDGNYKISNIFKSNPGTLNQLTPTMQTHEESDKMQNEKMYYDEPAAKNYGHVLDIHGNGEYWRKVYTTDDARLQGTSAFTNRLHTQNTLGTGRNKYGGLFGEYNQAVMETRNQMDQYMPGQPIGSYTQFHHQYKTIEEYF